MLEENEPQRQNQWEDKPKGFNCDIIVSKR